MSLKPVLLIISAGVTLLVGGGLFALFGYDTIGYALLILAVADLSAAISFAPRELRKKAPALFSPLAVFFDIIIMIGSAVFVIWSDNWVGTVPIIAIVVSFTIAAYTTRPSVDGGRDRRDSPGLSRARAHEDLRAPHRVCK